MHAMQCTRNNDLMIVEFHYSQQGQEDKEKDKFSDQLSRYCSYHNLFFKNFELIFCSTRKKTTSSFYNVTIIQEILIKRNYPTPAFHKENRKYLHVIYSCTCVL